MTRKNVKKVARKILSVKGGKIDAVARLPGGWENKSGGWDERGECGWDYRARADTGMGEIINPARSLKRNKRNIKR